MKNRLGDGVVAGASPRVASHYAPEPHPTTPQKSVALHGFQGVVGAARRESATGRNPARAPLIAPNQEHSNSLSHRFPVRSSKVLSSCSISPHPTAAEPGATTMMRSKGGWKEGFRALIAAWNLLRCRLRWGLVPSLREVAYPTRPSPRAERIPQTEPRTYLPSRKISSNRRFARPRPTLTLRRKCACGP